MVIIALDGGLLFNPFNSVLAVISVKYGICIFANMLTAKDEYSQINVNNGTPNNFVEQMVFCGAETVIGFRIKTTVDDCNLHAADFTSLTLQYGYTVNEAIDNLVYADDYIRDMQGETVVGGNGNQVLC